MQFRLTTWVRVVAMTGLLAALASSKATAVPILDYNIPQIGSGFTSIAPAGVYPGLTASNLAANGALVPNTFSNHFYFRSWNTTLNATKYYQNTINIASGSTLYLDDVRFSVESTQAGATFELRSSLDGFTSTIDSFTVPNVAVTNHLSVLTGLGPITGSVSFRFYATTLNSIASMGFANHLPGGSGAGIEIPGRNIRFNGRLVPEPGSLALVGLAGGVGLACGRRRRRG